MMAESMGHRDVNSPDNQDLHDNEPGAASNKRRLFNPIRSLKKFFSHHPKRSGDGAALSGDVEVQEQLTKSSSDLVTDSQDGDSGSSSKVLTKEMSMSTDCVFPNQAMMLNTGHSSQLFGIKRISDVKKGNLMSRLNDHISSKMAPSTEFSPVNFSSRVSSSSADRLSSASAAASVDTNCSQTRSLQPIEDVEEDFFKNKWTHDFQVSATASQPGAHRASSDADVDLSTVCRGSDGALDRSVVAHRLAVRPRGQRALSVYQPYLSGCKRYVRRHSIDATPDGQSSTSDGGGSGDDYHEESTTNCTSTKFEGPAICEPTAETVKHTEEISSTVKDNKTVKHTEEISSTVKDNNSFRQLPPKSTRSGGSNRKSSAPRRRTIAAPNDASIMTALALRKSSSSAGATAAEIPPITSSKFPPPDYGETSELALVFSRFKRRYSESSDSVVDAGVKDVEIEVSVDRGRSLQAPAATSGGSKIYTAVGTGNQAKTHMAPKAQYLTPPSLSIDTAQLTASAGPSSPASPGGVRPSGSLSSGSANPRKLSFSEPRASSKSTVAVSLVPNMDKKSVVGKTDKSVDVASTGNSSKANEPEAERWRMNTAGERPKAMVTVRAGSVSTSSNHTLPADVEKKSGDTDKSPTIDMSLEAIAMRRSKTAVSVTTSKENKMVFGAASNPTASLSKATTSNGQSSLKSVAKDSSTQLPPSGVKSSYGRSSNSSTATITDKESSSSSIRQKASFVTRNVSELLQSCVAGDDSDNCPSHNSTQDGLPGIVRQKSCPSNSLERNQTATKNSENEPASGATITIRKTQSIILKPLTNPSTGNTETRQHRWKNSRTDQHEDSQKADGMQKTSGSDAKQPENSTPLNAGNLAKCDQPQNSVDRVTGKSTVAAKSTTAGGCETNSTAEPSWFELARQKTQKWTEGKV